MSETTDRVRALLADVAPDGVDVPCALDLLSALCDEADAERRRADKAEVCAAVMRDSKYAIEMARGTDGVHALLMAVDGANGGRRIAGPSGSPWTVVRRFIVDGAEILRAAGWPDAGLVIIERLERAEAERDARGAILDRLRELVTTADGENPGWWIGTVEACADAFRERESMRAEKHAHARDREQLGMMVREVWVEWATEQPTAKASWLVPWAGLAEPDKEVDRRIGERLTWALRAENAALVARVAQLEEINEGPPPGR